MSEPKHGSDSDDGDRPDSGPDDSYDLEPAGDPDPPDSSEGDGDEDPGASAGGIDLACPSCGAAMPGSDQVVCLDCGHDLVTGRKVGETSPSAAAAPSTDSSPEVVEDAVDDEVVGGSDHLVWLIVAGVAVALTLLGMLAGWSSLFTATDGRYADSEGAFTLDAPRITVRLAAVIRYVVASTVVVCCGAIALRTAAWIESRPVGSVPGGLARLLAIVAVASLARLIPVESPTLQAIVHLVLSVGVVVGGSMLVFGLRGRIAILHLMTWALFLLIIVPAARLVAWAMPLW